MIGDIRTYSSGVKIYYKIKRNYNALNKKNK